MEKDIEKIEKFLRGQMSQEEEVEFKVLLTIDIQLRSLSFIVAYILNK